MAKSITVGKRENEKKRLAKREEKQKKKDSKKLSSKSSFDDMIAYVDENGMITSTPPAENIKKEEINLDEIIIASILDDTLGIDWKIPTEHANLSEKDTKHAMLKDFDSPFDINVDLYK